MAKKQELRPRDIVAARRVLLRLALAFLEDAEEDRWAIDMGERSHWALAALHGVAACGFVTKGPRNDVKRHNQERPMLQHQVEALCQIAEIAGRGLDYRQTNKSRSVAKQAVKAARRELVKLVKMYP